MTIRKKSTAMEMAYNLILEKITRERLVPGTPLREEHLAEEFGISTTPIREAFRSLEYEGWVQRIPYRGTCLRTFTNEVHGPHHSAQKSIRISPGSSITSAWKLSFVSVTMSVKVRVST